MRCPEVGTWLRRDVDGAAEPSAEAAAHLERCPSCAAEAERLRAIAVAARDSLPPADVPVDFTDRVMSVLARPAGDEALAAAARPRIRRWLPVLAAAAVLPLLLVLLRSDARNVVQLDRDGLLETGGVQFTALAPSRLATGKKVELLSGEVLCRTSRAVDIETELATIHLRADSECAIRIMEEEMKPALLTVTLIAGAAVVANAQGREEADRTQVVEVDRGKAPVVRRELARLRAAVARLQKRLDELEAIQRRRDRIRAVAARPVVVDETGILEEPEEVIEVEIIEESDEPRRNRLRKPARRGDPLEYLLEKDRRRDLTKLLDEARRGSRRARVDLTRLRADIDRVLGGVREKADLIAKLKAENAALRARLGTAWWQERQRAVADRADVEAAADRRKWLARAREIARRMAALRDEIEELKRQEKLRATERAGLRLRKLNDELAELEAEARKAPPRPKQGPGSSAVK